MLQFHEEHPVFVGRLERRDVLLANVHRRGGRVLKEHDAHESEGISDVGQRQRHVGKYQKLLRPGMFQNLGRVSDGEQAKKSITPYLLQQIVELGRPGGDHASIGYRSL